MVCDHLGRGRRPGDLAALLEDLQHQPRIFIIRGELIEGRHPGRVRRICHADPASGEPPYFRAKARRHLALDIDSFALPTGVDPVDVHGVAGRRGSCCRPSFDPASHWGQLTGSAGIKLGGRIRLWFWLSRAVSDVEAKRWLKGSPVDLTLYTVVQPHFVSSPVIALGAVDPVVGTRSALISGQVDVVTVPDLSEPARREAPRRSFVSFVSAAPRGVRKFARANGFGGKRSPRQELIDASARLLRRPTAKGGMRYALRSAPVLPVQTRAARP